MYYFDYSDDFVTERQTDEITREDLDYEGIYDYVQNEPDNEGNMKAKNFLDRYYKNYRYDY